MSISYYEKWNWYIWFYIQTHHKEADLIFPFSLTRKNDVKWYWEKLLKKAFGLSIPRSLIRSIKLSTSLGILNVLTRMKSREIFFVFRRLITLFLFLFHVSVLVCYRDKVKMQKEMMDIAQKTIEKIGFFHSGRLQYATSLRLTK